MDLENLSEKDKLLFKLALKELGIQVYGDIKYELTFVTLGTWFTPEYKIGEYVSRDNKYYFFGMPKTNNEIVNLLLEYFNLKNIEMVFHRDREVKYDRRMYF